jgi:G3E family GTPase
LSGTAVIVNEFGAVGIDDAIFVEAIEPGKVLLLANGCLCCTAGDDLSATMNELLGRDDPPQRIVIETTGLADPVPVILRLMSDPLLQQSVYVEGIVTTVDSVNGLETLSKHPVAGRQAAIADLRILTKTDLPDSQPALLCERLRTLNPTSETRTVTCGDISADELFAASRFDPFKKDHDPYAWLRLEAYQSEPLHTRQKRVAFGGAPDEPRSWVLEEEGLVDWSMLSRRLARIIGQHGDVLLRMKALIRTSDGDPRPLILHSVQRLFHPPVRLKSARAISHSHVVVIASEAAESAVEEIRLALREAAHSNLASTARVEQ